MMRAVGNHSQDRPLFRQTRTSKTGLGFVDTPSVRRPPLIVKSQVKVLGRFAFPDFRVG